MAPNLPTAPHPSMRTVWIIRSFIGAVFLPLAIPYVWIPLLIAGVEGRVPLVWFWVTLLGPPLLFAAWAAVYFTLYHARFVFRFREDAVIVKKGVWFRKTVHIPLRRVQDVIVKEGPLLGAFSLTTVHLQTAARGQTNVAEGRLPGLSAGPAVAEELMRRIERSRGD